MDAIFIVRQMQERHLGNGKKLYFEFVDLGLENAFDRVPRPQSSPQVPSPVPNEVGLEERWCG